MPSTRPTYLTIPEVASILRMTSKALRGRIERKTFPPQLIVRLPGEKGPWSIRIQEAEFYRWLDSLGDSS